uniref:Uncharacterized protein n=1 Tax=Arion vulgaris TaxID=1028688 RepID=A0A0B7A3N2_9EUPU
MTVLSFFKMGTFTNSDSSVIDPSLGYDLMNMFRELNTAVMETVDLVLKIK